MAVYNTKIIYGWGDSEEIKLTCLQAEITKAEQDGWKLVETFRYSGFPTAYMQKLKK